MAAHKPIKVLCAMLWIGESNKSRSGIFYKGKASSGISRRHQAQSRMVEAESEIQGGQSRPGTGEMPELALG
jgi:hypothetical protein